MKKPASPLEKAPDWTVARKCIGKSGMLSVIMPAYHICSIIENNIRRVYNLFSKNIPFEIIPVDDGSNDGTDVVLAKIASELPSVRPVILQKNSGKGTALKAGAAHARGNYILLLDGDLDLPPEPLSHFFEIMDAENADIVIGSKMHHDSIIDYPLRRRIASCVYYGIVKILVGLPVHDTQTGMKLFKTEALSLAFEKMLEKRFAFDVEVLSIAYHEGYRISEAPVKMEFGKKIGALTLQNVIATMNDTLAVFYRVHILRYYETLVSVSTPKNPPRVSAVIACPGPSTYLLDCLHGMSEQDYDNLEVIVLPDDQFSEDYTKQFPNNISISVIPTGRVRPAEKRNTGINKASGEIIAFIDDDASPLPGWLKRAVMYFGDINNAGVGGPAVTPVNDSFMSQISGCVFANPLVSGAYRRRYTPRRVCEEDDIPSCNLLVRKNLLNEIGGFDTRHWPGEDTLLCKQLVFGLGKKLMYDPWIAVSHHRRPLFIQHLRQISRYAKHRGVFARRFPETSRRISYMLPSFLLLGIVFGPVSFFIHSFLFAAYIISVLFYLTMAFVCSISIRHPLVWLVTFLGIVSTHMIYGAFFLYGLLGAKLPSDVAAFDHGGDISKRNLG